jgi:hypothetical protein
MAVALKTDNASITAQELTARARLVDEALLDQAARYDPE